MLLGSHLSIAGGLHRALARADDYGFDCVAMFVRNQRQWRARPMSDEAVERFRKVRRRLRIGPVVAHASYLVNLAGLADVRHKSIAAMREDLGRCGRLGIEYLVLHPGSRAQTDQGIAFIAGALNEIAGDAPGPGDSPQRTKMLLETTAGQGNGIGHTFEHLAGILERLECPKRFGVCLDTCHVFAAGYDIRTPAVYGRTMDAFDKIIGLENLLAVHLNDSARPLGSRIDRHAHIGRGRIGLAGLANIVNDPRLAAVPMILETPKGRTGDGRDWDEVNADAVRALIDDRRRRVQR